MIRRAVSLVLSIVVAGTLFAQQAPPPVAESIEVQLTNLDVIVTDASGNRVSGLTAADFEVVENGRKREITNLSEMRRAGTAQESVTATTPRRLLVAIDNRTVLMSSRKRTVAALRTTLEQLLSDPGDQVMFVTIHGSPKPRTKWTADRAEISRVLDEIEHESAASKIELAELDNMFSEMLVSATGSGPTSGALKRRQQRSNSGGNQRPGEQPRSEDDEEPVAPGVDLGLLMNRAQTFAATQAAETQQTISSLAASLNQFNTASDGKRLVVLVGGALPVFPGAEVYQRLESALRDIERNAANTNSGDSLARSRRQSSAIMEKTSFDMTKEIDALASYARMKGVAFYAVNPEVNDRQSKDIMSRRPAGSAQDFSSGNAAVEGFERLSLATGGVSHVGRQPELAFTQVSEDLNAYYSLGFRSPEPLTPDTKIVVKTKNGYKARAVLTAANIAPEWRVADAVVSNHARVPDANDMGIFLVANPIKAEGATRQIKVNVMIPFDRLRLTRDGRDYNCSFTVFVSVGDAMGGANPQRETRNFRWNEDTVNKLRGKNIAYGVDLTVGPGRDRVSVGILDLASGTTGFGKALLAQ
jgi:VWFA-related protein